MEQGLEILKFCVENFGLVATLAAIVMIFPIFVSIAMWRMAVSSQKALNNEIKEIKENEKELDGLVRGLLSIVKLFVQDKINIPDIDLDGKED